MSRPLLVLDLDGTVLLDNSWITLHAAFGLRPEEDRVLHGLYDEGILSYAGWTALILSIYRSRACANRQAALDAFATCRLHPATVDLVEGARDRGLEPALLSGGVSMLVDRIADQLDISLRAANHTLSFKEDGTVADLVICGDDVDFKMSTLQRWCLDRGVSPGRCFCVGDGANDRAIFELTGRGILICPPQNPPPFSNYWYRTSNLSSVLSIIDQELEKS